MNVQQDELYQRLQAFSLDEPNAKLPFSTRLARENRWSLDYTQRVIAEYKKFAFLAVVAEHPVSPSEQVDQVWHLHLTYTHSYWGEFCPNILQKPFHHNPTEGGSSEGKKFHDWYNKTLESYTKFFGETPPIEIWPPANIRFNHDIHVQRVNTEDYWIIPKFRLPSLPKFPQPALLGVWFLLTLGLTACESSLTNINNPLNFNGPQFLGFYILMGTAATFLAVGLQKWQQSQTTSLVPRQPSFIDYLPVSPLYAVLGLGVAKIFIGIYRGKPAGFLFVLCIITFFIACIFLPSNSSSRSSSPSSSRISSTSSSSSTSSTSSAYSGCSSDDGGGSGCGSSDGGGGCGGGCGGCGGCGG